MSEGIIIENSSTNPTEEIFDSNQNVSLDQNAENQENPNQPIDTDIAEIHEEKEKNQEEEEKHQEEEEIDTKLHHVDIEYCPRCGVPTMYCRFFGHKRYIGTEEEEEDYSPKKTKKEKPKPNVIVTVKQRTRRKNTTSIAHMEEWGIDIKEFSKSIAKKMAIGCSYNHDRNNVLQIVIQGNVGDKIIELLEKQYQIPKNNITAVKKVRRVKKPRLIAPQPEFAPLPSYDDEEEKHKLPLDTSSDESEGDDSDSDSDKYEVTQTIQYEAIDDFPEIPLQTEMENEEPTSHNEEEEKVEDDINQNRQQQYQNPNRNQNKNQNRGRGGNNPNNNRGRGGNNRGRGGNHHNNHRGRGRGKGRR